MAVRDQRILLALPCLIKRGVSGYPSGHEEARLRALKIGFLIMMALSLLAIFPANRLPGSTSRIDC